MSTITGRPRRSSASIPPRPSSDGDQRIVISGVGWNVCDDIADYPNPDLAIEIDLSDPKVDRPDIDAKLEIAEIWRFDGQSVVIEHLRDDGSYTPAETSRFLPLRPADTLRWLVDEDSDDELAWERRLDAWAKTLRRKKSDGRP
jgi:hypothetical protein